MARRHGFTIVEIVVVMTIMTMFLVIAIVSLNTAQASSRDSRRASDAEIIARGVEARYNTSNPKAVAADGSTNAGQYPGVNEILHAQGTTRAGFTPNQIAAGYLTSLLTGTTTSNYTTPSGGAFALIATTTVAAEVPATISAAVGTTTDKYIYEPIDSSNNVCVSTGCVRFNLYYRTEKDGMIHTIKSKHQ